MKKDPESKAWYRLLKVLAICTIPFLLFISILITIGIMPEETYIHEAECYNPNTNTIRTTSERYFRPLSFEERVSMSYKKRPCLSGELWQDYAPIEKTKPYPEVLAMLAGIAIFSASIGLLFLLKKTILYIVYGN